MTRLILITLFFLFSNSELLGQKSIESKAHVLAVDSIYNKTNSKGDTLSIVIKNLTTHDRGFTVEVIELSDEPFYYNAVFSAYINKDKSFFKKLRASKKSSRENNIGYVLPNYLTIPYVIKGNSTTTINFMIKGKPIKNGLMLKLRITSDIVNDDYETIYSDSFKVFSLPD